MGGFGRGGYAAALGALLVAGALAGAGMASADDDPGKGRDGRDGTATTHCKQKFSTDVYAPMQCYPSSADEDRGDSSGTGGGDDEQGNGGKGRNGAAGKSTNNGGRTEYKNPVTEERHFIPLPNVGYNPVSGGDQ
jgi:hypothetical protein